MESFSVFRAAGGSLARARARLIPFLHSTGRRSTIDDASTRQVYHPVQFTLIPRVIGRSGRYVRRVGTMLASSAHGPLELYTNAGRRHLPHRSVQLLLILYNLHARDDARRAPPIVEATTTAGGRRSLRPDAVSAVNLGVACGDSTVQVQRSS
jgi:hypothetical protein